jgi:hypothetical protein
MSTLVGGASPVALDYLLGEPAETVGLGITGPEQLCDPTAQRIERLTGIRVARRPEGNQLGDKWRYPTESLLAGLAAHRLPLVFTGGVRGSASSFGIGTWVPPGADASHLDAQQAVVRSLLHTSYLGVDALPFDPLGSPGPVAGGIVLGVPDPAPPERHDPATAWDRVLRAVQGSSCEATIVAEPVAEEELRRLRHKAIDELRTASMAEQPFGAAASQLPPLVKHYSTLLEQLLQTLNESLAGGGWRTAVYLTGVDGGFWRLAAAWRGVFTGDKTVLQPLRVAARDEAPALAAAWGRPYQAPGAAPGAWRHPFTAQTLLSTKQLAGYVHLPQVESPGFAVQLTPSFDTVAPVVDAAERIDVGRVVHAGRPTDAPYEVPVRDLTRHVLVTGVTGAGKSNTVFQLLDQVDRHGVPFLVLEPAKAEYRTLLSHPRLGERLQVLTVGDERVAPMRINPFAPIGDAPLAAHVDLLRSLFTATWSLWEPLPQVLERALHGVYEDHGWDLATGTNRRLGDEPAGPDAWPTLGELVDKTEAIVAELRYDPEAESRIRASLVSRLQSLRVGAKGRMLDTRDGSDPAALFERPTVIELERLGDEADRAFLMGLLLIQLGEHRRASGYHDGLRHLLVIEEAHRLLSNPTPRGEDQGNGVQKAVEGFVNLLAEIRVYGQGVVVADQVPVKLAPDAIKNTNLKVIHRLLAADDRQAVGGATAMDERQRDVLPTLRPGQAAVFSDGDDAPVLVQVPIVKDLRGAPSDDVVRQRAEGARATWACPTGCDAPPDACAVARRLAEDPSVREASDRILNSALADTAVLDKLAADLLTEVDRRRERADVVDAGAIATHLAAGFASRRGAQLGWAYAQTARLAGLLGTALRSSICVEGEPVDLTALVELVDELHRRTVEPFDRCAEICPDGLCLWRAPVAVAVTLGIHRDRWNAADAVPPPDRYAQLLAAADGVAERIVDEDPDRAVALCFSQQVVSGDDRRGRRERSYAIDNLLVTARQPEPWEGDDA